jgi:hypothetical protein
MAAKQTCFHFRQGGQVHPKHLELFMVSFVTPEQSSIYTSAGD